MTKCHRPENGSQTGANPDGPSRAKDGFGMRRILPLLAGLCSLPTSGLRCGGAGGVAFEGCRRPSTQSVCRLSALQHDDRWRRVCVRMLSRTIPVRCVPMMR